MQSIAVPLTRCLAVLTYIPIFAFFPWTVSLSRSILAMLDWLSYNWLLAQLHSPGNEFKLVITLIHEDLESWRHRLDLPKHAPMTSFPNPEGVIAQDNSELNLREKLQILIMPKITYPRPCPTCGKELNRRHFFRHMKRCGTFEHQVQCPQCPLTFGRKDTMQYHLRQQHSNNPLSFSCTICGTELTSAKNLRLHVRKVRAFQKPCFDCWYCNVTFTWKISR